jgi:DNA-binding NarL/FixJ family response regulator
MEGISISQDLNAGIRRGSVIMISVLYIDDSQLLLDVTCLFLERDRDITVDISLSMEEAIRKLDYITYDVIVTDYLPEGRNVIHLLDYLAVKAISVPLICLSAFPPDQRDIFTNRNPPVIFVHKLGNSHSHFTDLLHAIREVAPVKKEEHASGNGIIPMVHED